MKLLFDQNLSPKLANDLAIEFPDSAHVRQFGMQVSEDAIIWDYAKANEYKIVSKDFDYLQRSILYGNPPKVILIKAGNSSTQVIANLLRAHFLSITLFANEPFQSLLILS